MYSPSLAHLQGQICFKQKKLEPELGAQRYKKVGQSGMQGGWGTPVLGQDDRSLTTKDSFPLLVLHVLAHVAGKASAPSPLAGPSYPPQSRVAQCAPGYHASWMTSSRPHCPALEAAHGLLGVLADALVHQVSSGRPSASTVGDQGRRLHSLGYVLCKR